MLLLRWYVCWKQAQHFRAHSKVSTDKGPLHCVLFFLLVLLFYVCLHMRLTAIQCTTVLHSDILKAVTVHCTTVRHTASGILKAAGV